MPHHTTTTPCHHHRTTIKSPPLKPHHHTIVSPHQHSITSHVNTVPVNNTYKKLSICLLFSRSRTQVSSYLLTSFLFYHLLHSLLSCIFTVYYHFSICFGYYYMITHHHTTPQPHHHYTTITSHRTTATSSP